MNATWWIVRLGGEQVAVICIDDMPITKFQLRVFEKGKLRKLTRDEELAGAAAPGTKLERDAAIRRLGNEHFIGMEVELKYQQWRPNEKALAIAQMQRESADNDELN